MSNKRFGLISKSKKAEAITVLYICGFRFAKVAAETIVSITEALSTAGESPVIMAYTQINKIEMKLLSIICLVLFFKKPSKK